MAELTTMRPRVLKALRGLDAIAVENSALPGTPDVNFIEGWLELKWLREWPARLETVVEVDHFTPQQRIFHIRRSRVGGNTWVLLQVRNEWLLFTGPAAADYLGRVCRADLLKVAYRHWPKGLREEELLECVSRRMRGC